VAACRWGLPIQVMCNKDKTTHYGRRPYCRIFASFYYFQLRLGCQYDITEPVDVSDRTVAVYRKYFVPTAARLPYILTEAFRDSSQSLQANDVREIPNRSR
jgi:hypothetical protein